VSEGGVADDEEEAKEEAEVRTLVGNRAPLVAVGVGFYTPPEENKEPLPVAGSSVVP
jgi:hypothetical protein